MPYIRYEGPFDGVATPDGESFPRGEVVHVSTELAEALISRPDFVQDRGRHDEDNKNAGEDGDKGNDDEIGTQ
jgi:hypothetical protein